MTGKQKLIMVLCNFAEVVITLCVAIYIMLRTLSIDDGVIFFIIISLIYVLCELHLVHQIDRKHMRAIKARIENPRITHHKIGKKK